MRPSTHGPGHTDLAFRITLEPFRKEQASQATRSTVTFSNSHGRYKNPQ